MLIGRVSIPIACTIDYLQCRKTSKGNGTQTSYTCILILIQKTKLRPLSRYPLSLLLLFIQNQVPSIMVNTWILDFEASKNKIRSFNFINIHKIQRNRPLEQKSTTSGHKTMRVSITPLDAKMVSKKERYKRHQKKKTSLSLAQMK